MADLQTVEESELDNIYGIELDCGQVVCPECNGSCLGEWEQPAYSSCKRCWGSGKLDWIELAMGKERPCALSGYSSSSSRNSTSCSSSVTVSAPSMTVNVSSQIAKRRNVNGNNSQFGFGKLKRLSEMFNKSKGSLQRR